MRPLRLLAIVAALAVIAALRFFGPEETPPPRTSAEAGAVTAPASVPGTSAIGFRSADRLEEHYRKHGREFGGISASEYLALAQSLRDRPAGGAVLELRRPDGVMTRFDRASGAFIAFDPDLTIRTYFRPNDGETYFRRQARRSGSS